MRFKEKMRLGMQDGWQHSAERDASIEKARDPEGIATWIDCYAAHHNEQTGVVELLNYSKMQHKVLLGGEYVLENGNLKRLYWSPEIGAWVYFEMDTWGGCRSDFAHLEFPNVERHGKQYEPGDKEFLRRVDEEMDAGELGETYQRGIDPSEGNKQGFIFADWEDIDDGLPLMAMHLGIAPDQSSTDILRSMGFSDELHFQDDSDLCSCCGKILYTSNGSYEGRYEETEDGLLCSECVHKDNQDAVIEACVNSPHQATVILTDEELTNEGFQKVDEKYAHGWYGNNDDPEKISAKLHEKWYDVLFQISDCNPFNVDFYVWVRDQKEPAAMAEGAA